MAVSGMDHPSSQQALFALIVMVIILIFILVYCCWGAFTCNNENLHLRRLTESPTTRSCFGSQTFDRGNQETLIILPYRNRIYAEDLSRRIFDFPLNIDKPPPYSEVFDRSCPPPVYRSTCNSRASSVLHGLDLPPPYEESNKLENEGKLQTPSFGERFSRLLSASYSTIYNPSSTNNSQQHNITQISADSSTTNNTILTNSENNLVLCQNPTKKPVSNLPSSLTVAKYSSNLSISPSSGKNLTVSGNSLFSSCASIYQSTTHDQAEHTEIIIPEGNVSDEVTGETSTSARIVDDNSLDVPQSKIKSPRTASTIFVPLNPLHLSSSPSQTRIVQAIAQIKSEKRQAAENFTNPISEEKINKHYTASKDNENKTCLLSHNHQVGKDFHQINTNENLPKQPKCDKSNPHNEPNKNKQQNICQNKTKDTNLQQCIDTNHVALKIDHEHNSIAITNIEKQQVECRGETSNTSENSRAITDASANVANNNAHFTVLSNDTKMQAEENSLVDSKTKVCKNSPDHDAGEKVQSVIRSGNNCPSIKNSFNFL